MKIGGDTLRLAIRDEVRTMQVLRVKMFCEVAAAEEKESREKEKTQEKQVEKEIEKETIEGSEESTPNLPRKYKQSHIKGRRG